MNFELARFNMVEQQIRPWNVNNPDLLNLLATIPRERFIPQALQSFAFADCELQLDANNMIPPPSETAKIIEGLHITASDKILEVDVGCGYQTALLANLAQQVCVLESNPDLLQRAKDIHSELAIQNISYLSQETELSGNYDVIILNTPISKEDINKYWLGHLASNGKLFAIIGQKPVMSAMVFSKKNNHLVSQTLFETLRANKISSPFCL